MKVGYARVSTQGQDYENQVKTLQSVGCEELFIEKESAIRKRPELEKALNFVRKGDTFIVTSLDRLGRSVPDLWGIVQHLQKKDVHFNVLDFNLDTNTPAGSLTFTMLAAVAAFERAMILKRTQEGREAAKKKGIKFGRKPVIAKDEAKLAAIKADILAEELSMQEIAEKYGISRDRIYKLVGSRKALKN